MCHLKNAFKAPIVAHYPGIKSPDIVALGNLSTGESGNAYQEEADKSHTLSFPEVKQHLDGGFLHLFKM